MAVFENRFVKLVSSIVSKYRIYVAIHEEKTGTMRNVEERSPGITYQQLLDEDTHPVPDVLRLESAVSFGPDEFPITRYTTREWHEVEKEKLWSRVWQYACRADEIPEVGDYYVYEIVGKSYVVMRSSKNEIKARVQNDKIVLWSIETTLPDLKYSTVIPVKMPIKRTKREITSKIVCNRSASFIAGKKLTKIFDLLFLIDN